MNNYRDLLVERISINQQARTDLKFRREVLEKCAADSVYWCNNFAFTFDPRQEFYEVRKIPFILFDKQIELVRWVEGLLENSEDGMIEKSRDTGVSYTTLIPIVLYRWLFHEFNAKVGSRKEEYVDKSDDPDSLFWKLDYTLRLLPDWMLPEGFDWGKHRAYMRLSRPDNSNTITGESANPNFARAGRNNITLFDELGFWSWSKSSWEAAGESTTTRLAISTPPESGKSSFFYKLAASGRVKKFVFHYKQDPRKTTDWEAKQRTKKSDEEFERELNISYSGSSEGKVYAKNLATVAYGKYEYNPHLPLFCAWDFGLDGTAIQWYQWDHKLDRWYLIDSAFGVNEDIGFFVPFITGVIESGSNYEYTTDELLMIAKHKDWKKEITHFGDPDVAKRSYLDKKLSTRMYLRAKGIYVQSKPWAGRSHYDLKQTAIQFMKKLSIDETANEFFLDAMRQATYPKKPELSQSTSEVTKPVHDWTSHHRSAFEYMADNAPVKIAGEMKKSYTKKRTSIWDR